MRPGISTSTWSPSRISPIPPPAAASGETWPTRRAAGRTGETPVGDERYARTQPHPGESGGRIEHLAHSRAALGPFIADDYHVSRLDFTAQNGFGSSFLRIEAAGRTGVLHHLGSHRTLFDHRTFGGDVAGQDSQYRRPCGRDPPPCGIISPSAAGNAAKRSPHLAGNGGDILMDQSGAGQLFKYGLDPSHVIEIGNKDLACGVELCKAGESCG